VKVDHQSSCVFTIHAYACAHTHAHRFARIGTPMCIGSLNLCPLFPIRTCTVELPIASEVGERVSQEDVCLTVARPPSVTPRIKEMLQRAGASGFRVGGRRTSLGLRSLSATPEKTSDAAPCVRGLALTPAVDGERPDSSGSLGANGLSAPVPPPHLNKITTSAVSKLPAMQTVFSKQEAAIDAPVSNSVDSPTSESPDEEGLGSSELPPEMVEGIDSDMR
jgi:hypothetical protein